MTSKEDSQPTRGQIGAEQEDASGLAEMLSGLLGGGGGSAPLQALLGQLGGGQNSETEGLSPELLSALAKTPAAGAAASPIPDVLKRAVEALGLPPALVEKLLPSILSQLPALGRASPQAPASSSVHKQPAANAETPAKPAKPRKSSSKPVESTTAKKPKTSESTTAKKPKTPKSSSTRKPSGSSSKPRSSGSSGSTSRKRKSEPDAIGLDDILKALIK
ncbi:MAG: hypothetical protein NT169_10965 [Chloroflexi bacterium]|nr:hypothetical protein [Chloroflexota bacterium]